MLEYAPVIYKNKIVWLQDFHAIPRKKKKSGQCTLKICVKSRKLSNLLTVPYSFSIARFQIAIGPNSAQVYWNKLLVLSHIFANYVNFVIICMLCTKCTIFFIHFTTPVNVFIKKLTIFVSKNTNLIFYSLRACYAIVLIALPTLICMHTLYLFLPKLL